MLDTLRTAAQPYGGDIFLYLSFVAVASYLALVYVKARMAPATLRRFMRVAALVALAGSWFAMQQGEQYFASALLPLAWGIAVGMTCAREIRSRQP